MNFDLAKITSYAVSFIIILISLSMHEAAHAFAAKAQGDDTAEKAGRLTLNPLAHLDPVGTILLPLLLTIIAGVSFGWAKPVPVNPYKLKWPKWGYVIVSAAGPIANITLSVIAIIGLISLQKYGKDFSFAHNAIVNQILVTLTMANIFLATFNLIPIHPLDGAAIFTAFLPRPLVNFYYRFIAPYGMFIVMALLYTGGLDWIKYIAYGFIGIVGGTVSYLLPG